MSIGIAPATRTANDQSDQRVDFNLRFLHAGIADPALFSGVPPDALLFLLPDDDPAFVAGEITAGVAALSRGQDVYFRHVRVADLPVLPPRSAPAGPVAGERRVSYGADGEITYVHRGGYQDEGALEADIERYAR